MPDTMTVEATTIEFGTPPADASQVPAVAEAALPAEATGGGTIFSLIERASRDPSVDIDKMERLILMQERMQAKQAQVEFDNAMSDAQESMKAIRADAENSQTRSKYATYAALDKAIRPIYAKHGFALTFNTGDAARPEELRVLATLSHRGGHRQDYKIDMPADGKGARGNDVMTKTHATGAAAQYGQRYLLKFIFNLAVGDVDDDGNGAGGYEGDGDVESLGTGPRGPDGKLLSTYDVDKVKKAQQWADAAIQRLNLMSGPLARQEAINWRDEANTVPKGKRKAPLTWLKENSPGQYLRVRQVYQNASGEDLE